MLGATVFCVIHTYHSMLGFSEREKRHESRACPLVSSIRSEHTAIYFPFLRRCGHGGHLPEKLMEATLVAASCAFMWTLSAL